MKSAVCLHQVSKSPSHPSLLLGVSRKDNALQFGLPGGKLDPGEDVVEYLTTTYVGDIAGDIPTCETGIVVWVSEDLLLDGPFRNYNAALFQHLRSSYV